MSQVIVLNNSYQPLNVVSSRKAIKMILKDKVEVLSNYDDTVFNTWDGAINAPLIVRMKYFVRTSTKMRKNIPLTRKNIWTRDGGKCQYCGKEISIGELTFDHVVPRSRDGRTTWENIVASCKHCNTVKRNRTPEEAGMHLRSVPRQPELPVIDMNSIMRSINEVIKHIPKEAWADHIYWNVELEN